MGKPTSLRVLSAGSGLFTSVVTPLLVGSIRRLILPHKTLPQGAIVTSARLPTVYHEPVMLCAACAGAAMPNAAAAIIATDAITRILFSTLIRISLSPEPRSRRGEVWMNADW